MFFPSVPFHNPQDRKKPGPGQEISRKHREGKGGNTAGSLPVNIERFFQKVDTLAAFKNGDNQFGFSMYT